MWMMNQMMVNEPKNGEFTYLFNYEYIHEYAELPPTPIQYTFVPIRIKWCLNVI